MLEFLQTFFAEDLFIPHGHCYLWKPGLVGLHILSDSLIALAYFSIPLELISLYQECYPHPAQKIQTCMEEIDLDFIKEDLPKILSSMNMGADRIRNIVLSLRNFSRLDEAEIKQVDIHEGIDSTLLILQNRLQDPGKHINIQVIKEHGNLPKIDCYPGQLNQVFMNILANAIDTLKESILGCQLSMDNLEIANNQQLKTNNPQIRICTEVIDNNQVVIRIADNGCGMTEAVKQKIFDPFFTTKPVGSGTGLGMSISYQIVNKHGGILKYISAPFQGTEFLIQIPIQMKSA